MGMIKFICKNCKHWEPTKELTGECKNPLLKTASRACILTEAEFGCNFFDCEGIYLSAGEIVVDHPAITLPTPDHT